MPPKPLPLLLILALASSAALVSAHGGSADDDAVDPTAPPPNLRAKSLILVKVWCLIIVFAATFAAGVSPYFLKWNETFLVLGTQFAGGIFLATAMIHFLSDSNESFEDLTDLEYPFAFMLACAGYVITMLADCVIAMVVERKRGVSDLERNGGNLELQNKQNANGATQQPDAVNCTPHESTAALLRDANSLGDSILLIAALCFHSVFEGIAIGVAENKADAWKALWTISLHKIFAAIAMGIALLRMMPHRPLLSTVSYSFAFAISSPIGVAIGIIIDSTTQGRVADWIYAISMGLACGIFVYVAINHLLAKGYKPRQQVAADRPFVRWLAVVSGVAVLAVVMIWDT